MKETPIFLRAVAAVLTIGLLTAVAIFLIYKWTSAGDRWETKLAHIDGDRSLVEIGWWNDMVFVADGSGISACNAKSGSIVWQQQFPQTDSLCLFMRDSLLLLFDSRMVARLDPASGRIRWSREDDWRQEVSSVLPGKMAYSWIVTDSILYAIDNRSGRDVYQIEVHQDSAHRTSCVATQDDLWSWNSKEICKFDAKTGLQVWCDTTLEIPPIAHLLVQDSMLIFSTLTKGILVLNPSHGEAVPIPTDLQNGGIFGPIAASSSRIFLLKDDPFTLLAWDPGKDKIAWKVDLTEYGNYFFANFHGPVYAQGHVYVSGAGLSKVLKFNAEDGRIEDERDLPAKMESLFLVKDGMLDFAGRGKLFGIPVD